MDIGSRIRSARKRAGLSQEAVARRAGMSVKGMGDIERGDIADPHYSSLVGIATALGVSVGELVGEGQAAVPKAEAPGAGQRGGELLDSPAIGEWLRERGAEWGAMGDEDFRAYVRGLDLDDDVDEEGRPVAVMELGRALTEEQDRAKDLLWNPSSYRSLDALLPVDPDGLPTEQRRQRRERLGELRGALRRRYGRRANALKKYAEWLSDPEAALWALASADEAA